MIQFKLGQFYHNKSAKYLIPILNSYSNTFKIIYKKVRPSLICSAIGDVCYEYAKGKDSYGFLYFVYDINGSYVDNKYVDAVKSRQNLLRYLDYVRTMHFYIDDYAYEVGRYHCVVLKIPDAFISSYDMFLESKYSLMYTDEQLKQLFIKNKSNTEISHVYGVLTKHPDYRKTFETKLNEYFGTTIEVDDDRELDLPLDLNKEILNKWMKKHS